MKEPVELSKQQRKSKETKERIFQAAKRILQKSGYEELSIKNICEEAGVSNGSFYHHFKTKDDLLSYYIEDQPSIDPDRLELPKNKEDAKETIIHVYLNYVKYCKEHGGILHSAQSGVKPYDSYRASIPNRHCSALFRTSFRSQCDSIEFENRGNHHRYPYDCHRKCI